MLLPVVWQFFKFILGLFIWWEARKNRIKYMKVLFSLALVDYTGFLQQVFFKSSYSDRDDNITIDYSWWFYLLKWHLPQWKPALNIYQNENCCCSSLSVHSQMLLIEGSPLEAYNLWTVTSDCVLHKTCSIFKFSSFSILVVKVNRCWMINLLDSVLPAPDSPEMMQHWGRLQSTTLW